MKAYNVGWRDAEIIIEYQDRHPFMEYDVYVNAPFRLLFLGVPVDEQSINEYISGYADRMKDDNL